MRSSWSATTKKLWLASGLLSVAFALHLPAHAQGAPEITPSLKKLLGGLPIAGIKDEVQGMVAALKKTGCGNNLTGCYMTQSGALQLYFFTSGTSQQTLLLVVDKSMKMPRLLGEKAQKVMGDSSLSAPIISLSTTDYALDNARMPPALQKVVRENYFNVSTLAFSSGVQLAARTSLSGSIKQVMESMGVNASQLTMRAAVVMPIPSDLAGGAGAGAGAAQAVSHGDTMKKAGADAAKPEAFVEFQFAPQARLALGLPAMVLTDATFFLNNSLVFGYKGNAAYKGAEDKTVLVQFQTPLTPEGAMDLVDFQFRMATPAKFTLEDAAHVMVAMANTDPRLVKYGGGFIRNIASYQKALLSVAKPLSVFQLRNPSPAPEYRFGDSSKPWPDDPKFYNIVLLGPLAEGGPFFRGSGEATILGQRMGSIDASAGLSGLHGQAMQDLSLKLGPLGRVTVQQMLAEVDVDQRTQNIRLTGNYRGQVVEAVLAGSTLRVEVSANCVNPFKISTSATLQASTDLAEVFEGAVALNVDPKTITGCADQQLEAAYRKIAGEYKQLGGYTASAATAELNKMANAAAAEAQKAAEEEAQKAADAARKEYEKTKDDARNAANNATSEANKAFNDAGNAFKRLGKKKKHKKKGPDPKFAASVFDWDYYYDANPDLVEKRVDLAQNWKDTGFLEGRRGSLEFHAVYYRNRYTDVQALCASTDLQCVLQHWLDQGIEEGRQGSPDFNVDAYRFRYKDVPFNLTPGEEPDAMEHWLTVGADGGRNGKPDNAFAGPISGPTRVGGGGGSEWSDGCTGSVLTGFRIAAGRTVDRVQFRYPTQKVGMFKTGGWSDARGSNAAWTGEVKLAEGEYIVQVDYRKGSKVDSLTFRSNTGKTYGPYGGGGGSPGTYKVTPGEKLSCMSGRSGSSIDQLTFTSTGPR